MSLRIVCAGYLIRYPLGGFCWHHLQYLLGLARLGHHVTYVEHFGWPGSCYDPAIDDMTSDPAYGAGFLRDLLTRFDLGDQWCYLAEDGSTRGLSRDDLADACRRADVFFNLDNMNWTDELALCRRRVLIDTDPVFTQTGFGTGIPLERYQTLFTYGENVHQKTCSMPTAGARWLPTRQPVVLDAWTVHPPAPTAPFTTVMSWSAYGEHTYEGRTFSQKDRELIPYMDFPRRSGHPMELALNAPPGIKQRLSAGGWKLADPIQVTRSPWTYQDYLGASLAEFSIAKHGYVVTRSGWFSDRSAGYLASGRPVVLQDTGYPDYLPCGQGLLPFQNAAEALVAVRGVRENYEEHCAAARRIAEEYFDARRVLPDLLEKAL
jgi:hypothetical protein